MTNLNNINDAPNFSLKDLVIDAKVISVYDGDTIKCIFPFKGEFYKWNCRLSGIDTPEIRTRCKKEKEYGYKVRDILRNRILNTKESFIFTFRGGDPTQIINYLIGIGMPMKIAKEDQKTKFKYPAQMIKNQRIRKV